MININLFFCMNPTVSVTGEPINPPDFVNISIPFHGEDLNIQLQKDRAMFGDSGPEDQMCHYTGTVAGMEDSRVLMSICKSYGIDGIVYTDDFNAEIRPADTFSALGPKAPHVIYNLKDLTNKEGTGIDQRKFINTSGKIFSKIGSNIVDLFLFLCFFAVNYIFCFQI